MKKQIYLLTLFVVISVNIVYGQTDTLIPGSNRINSENKSSIEFSPLSPFLNIYALIYSYKISNTDELQFGASYMNIKFDFGNTNSPAIILGYRKYLWGNFHVEYQIWPAYDKFYEKKEDKHYESFDIWNEFRIGYKFNFTLANLPCHLNIQWPFGFGLYASNKPESFKDHEKENRFFYFPPLLFLGIEL